MEESQAPTVLGDDFYDDPSQLSQALRQRACSDKSFHFTTSTESPNSGDNTVSTFTGPLEANHAFLRASVGLVQFDRALSPRRATTAKHVKPALARYHSAPTSTGNIRLDGADKMYHSFNIADAPGDTQPDSQMMKTWTSGIFPTTDGRGARVPTPKSLFVEHSEEENDDDMPTDEMDVVASSQQIHVPTPVSHTMVDVDEHGDTAQNSLAPTSPLKFQTPALGERKRASSGQILSSGMRTSTTPGSVPSAPFFFGNEGGGEVQHISLTQAFNNTQAPTSPVVGRPGEDVVFTRPSPNFTHTRHSSPIPAYSSPIKATRRDPPKSEPIMRSSSVPRTDYVTMKESQERRNRSVGNEHDVIVEQDSWEELSRKVKARKSREYAYRQVAESLSHVSAPMPSLPRSEIKRKISAGYPSPSNSRVSRNAVRATSHHDDVVMDGQSQPIMVNEANKHNSDHSADETSQAAARTMAEHNSIQVPKTSSHPHLTPSAQPSGNSTQQPSPSSQHQRKGRQRESGSQYLRAPFQPASSKESVAVMDSQPDVTADFESVPRPKSLRFPSSPVMSQYSINQTTMATKTGFTSQVISSSIPPLPPRSSQEIVTPEEDRVPSSPPIMVPGDGDEEEGDLEYDEHAYDEYAEGGAEDATIPSPDNDGDTVMDQDEDDLPLPKEEPEDEDAENESSQLREEHVDMMHPCKAEFPNEEDVPVTVDQEQPEGHMHHNQESRRNIGANSSNAPRMQRQNTIPDTDALDDTQPSGFSRSHSEEVIGDDATAHNDTNSTEQFQTAQEEPSKSQSNMPAPISSRDQGSDTVTGGSRIRSIDDIYNLPETQQSPAEEDVEMPRLSGVEEDDEDMSMSRTSPALPSAKRRKVTYTVKRPVFGDSTMATTDTPLSEPPSSPQLRQIQHALEATPPIASTQEQEEQGARAAARLREEAQVAYKPITSLKSKILPKPKKQQNQRHGALKSVSRELLKSVSSPANSPSRPKVPARSRATTPVTPSKPKEVASKAPAKTPADVDMTDVHNDTIGPTSSAPPPSNVERTPSQQSETPLDDIVVPNRVFASWPGSHYYPATCLGRPTSQQLQIRYDDGNITSIDAVYVRALDLRKGDHVKVDVPGMKKTTYVVVGFTHKMHDVGCEEFPTTDQRGYASVILEEKARNSLPAAKALQTTEQVSVPVSDIYLTSGLWKRLRDRSFNFGPPISPTKTASHIGTPVPDHFATPSFTRRGTAIPSVLKDFTTRPASVASTTRSGTGVFVNMAFVLTSTAADVDKEAITKTIRRNGGQVLEHGFHELFDYESSDAPCSSQNRRRSSSSVEGSGLTLKHAYRDLGFVALISDSHSRSTKYIQALALNVPCLHLRWIQDSLNASRAAPFTRYLLPAGVSKFLDPNGVIRSRTMVPYDPAGEDTFFAQTIEKRDLLFNNQNILLVTGRSKKEMDKRQPFVFLSHALGSASVGLCADLDTAGDMLGDNKWDWVYVDNGERGVAEAAAELFGAEKPPALGKAKKAGKKRRRDEAEPEVQEHLVVKSRVGAKTVSITCSEFVIQSLILGALVEE